MADGMNQPGPEDGEADAAQAFEALRAEVAALRRGMELLYRQMRDGQGVAAPVDYSPTLGGMAKTLQMLEGRLRAIEGKPALELTPARFEDGIRTAGHWAGEQGRAAMQTVVTALVEAKREFEGVLAGARTRREQQAWIGATALVSAMAGVLLWFMAVALLPWGMGHKLVAMLVHTGGRWEAGQVLMQEGDPASWDRLARLGNACPKGELTELCEAAMAVRTIPPLAPAQPASEGTKVAPPGPPGTAAATPATSSQARGRVEQRR